MQIVFASGWYPFPPDNGARIRIYNLLRELGRRHSVHLVSFYDESSRPTSRQIDPLLEFCSSVEIVARKEYKPQGSHTISALISGEPPWITRRYNPSMTNVVQRIFDENYADMLFISQVQMLPVLDRLLCKKPIILEQFEVGTLKDRVDAARGITRLKRLSTWNIWAQYISTHLSKLHGITVPSEGERRILNELQARRYPTLCKVKLLPNGVSEDYCHQAETKSEQSVLIYQGSMEFAANLDAMEYFLSEIMPLIIKVEPEVLLRITGSYEDADLSTINGHDCVELTGYLDEVTETVSAASVCVIPLRFGSGTRIKALESMALGTPVVSTSKGVQGIDVRDGVHALIADDPQSFARNVIRILTDKNLSIELARNARDLVLGRYTWTKIGDQLNDFCETVAMDTLKL